MDLPYLTGEAISAFIASALDEDLGDGDHTSLAALTSSSTEKARLILKDEGILAGVGMAKEIFLHGNSDLVFDESKKDGSRVQKGEIAFTVVGNARTILGRERLVLNCMQRMSGIATYTAKLQSLIAHTKARVTDTRKTTPNFRIAEKWAVSIGGGVNHRVGLYDKILLKDNHVDYAGGIKKAIIASHEYLRDTKRELEIEIEVRSLEELKEVIEIGGIQTIMLDNMSLEDMTKSVEMINGMFTIEASGNITERNIKEVAECGVDLISVGALTHSYKSLDMSLKAF